MNQRDAQFSGLLLVLAAAIASSFFATSAAAQSWDEVVKAAINEGEVVVHGAPGKVYEQVLTEGFRKAYLDIKLDFTGTSGRDVVEAILREREGGVFRWDVYVGGTPSILQTLKPAGAFAPLRPALILPEVVDSKLWRGGFDAGWMDKEKTYTYSFDLTMDPLIAINQDVVAPGAFTSFKDLLKPEFANKIVWDDPRLPGAGVLVGQTLLMNFGEDLLKQIFSTQKIVYSTNRRQQAEWVVSGTYPIGVATPVDELGLFQAQGLGKNVVWFKGDLTKFAGDTAFGTVSLMDRAPHPNAAKVYINWLLSKAGQTDYGRSKRNTRRLDVPPGDPATLPTADVPETSLQAEDQIPIRDRVSKLATELIPTSGN